MPRTTEDNMVKVCVRVQVDLEHAVKSGLKFDEYIQDSVRKIYKLDKFKVAYVQGCSEIAVVVLHVDRSELDKLYPLGIFGISLN